MKSIKLSHCNNYHYFPRKETFVGGKTYVLADDYADLLLSRTDDEDYPYFEEVSEKKKPANRPKRGAKSVKVKAVQDEGPEDDEDDSTTDAVSL